MNLYEICDVNMADIDSEIKDILYNDPMLCDQHKELLLNLTINSGKKLRPLFTIVGSYFGNKEVNNINRYGALIELVHTATLIHDDVIDQADTRRGDKALHHIIGSYNAVMLGNYLMSRCAELIHDLDVEDIYYQEIKLTDLCESEIKQQDLLFNYDISLKEYIDKTKNKTALLIAASFISGATMAGARRKTLKYIYQYAINLGISFQIIDDILDYTQSDSQLGKPAGQDLMNGNITLPVIYALKDKKLRKKIRSLNKHSEKEDFEVVINFILNSNAIKKSKQLSKKYIKRAKRAICKIDGKQTHILNDILSELEKRTF